MDRIVAGEPETAVNGIATTMMATLDMMQSAAAAGKNLVITHESTFYSHQDSIDQLKDHAAYQFHPRRGTLLAAGWSGRVGDKGR